MNVIEGFKDSIQAAGLVPPDEIIADGRIKRFSSSGKRGDDAGWYICYNDGIPAGCFGDWRSGESTNWRADIGRILTPNEEQQHKSRIERMQLEREIEQKQIKNTAKEKALSIWTNSESCIDHPYLTNKNIKPHGVRIKKECLVIPLLEKGDLHSLQFINKDGSKKFLSGGRIKGCYHSIGDFTNPEKICIAEGLATAATIHEATNYPVIVAFNAGNLLPVARTIHAEYPSIDLYICGDTDRSGVGQKKANECADAVGGIAILPPFTNEELSGDTPPSDWNDYENLHGTEAVKKGLINVSATMIKSSPEPLPSLPEVDAFDYLFLPDSLRGYVKDISERMQCPPDFAAVGVFVMIGSIIGRKVGIRPMQYNDWTVIPNLWGGIIGNSGIMKSPTLSEVLAPVKRLQAKAYEEFTTTGEDHIAQTELLQLQKVTDRNKAKKALKDNDSAKALEILKSGEEAPPPILKRYITNNASYEALGEVLIENPNGLLVESDELVGLLKQLDANGQDVSRSFYLTAADGDKGYTFDRIMRGKALHVPALCLSIIGGIQPGVLAEYVRQATGGEGGADGLLQRFSLMVYPDINPEWEEVDRSPDASAREAVSDLVNKLNNFQPLESGAEESHKEGVPYFRFDTEGHSLFSEWRAELEAKLRSDEEHPALVSHFSKYRKLIPTLALINHLCDVGYGEVTKDSLLRAISFSKYLESHARRIYSYATRPDIDSAKTILSRLRSGKLNSIFTARDVYRKGWAGIETPAKARAAIDLLEEYGHLTKETTDSNGRPSTNYHWVKGGNHE